MRFLLGKPMPDADLECLCDVAEHWKGWPAWQRYARTVALLNIDSRWPSNPPLQPPPTHTPAGVGFVSVIQ